MGKKKLLNILLYLYTGLHDHFEHIVRLLLPSDNLYNVQIVPIEVVRHQQTQLFANFLCGWVIVYHYNKFYLPHIPEQAV
jgi:hypothetical protein